MKNNYINKKKSLVLATSFVLISMVLIPLVTAEMDNGQISDDEIIKINEEFIDPASFATHHKVLAEQGTATWCQYCPSMSYWIAQVSGDFQYVALVSDMNPYASSRMSELGISGIPDSHFDGGFTNVLGGQSGVTNLQNAYNVCQSRTVADVDLTTFAIWNSLDSSIDITVYIDNTGPSTYNGHLHVYVIEETSRWLDYDGIYYSNAMIGNFPIHKNIAVNSGDTLIESSSGFTYPGIVRSNIEVVVAVFGGSPTGYTDETDVVEPSSGGDDDDDDDDDNGPPLLIPKTKISEPGTGDIINGTVTISGTSHHPEGDQRIKWTMVKIDDGAWVETDEEIYWSLEWDTTTVEDGSHTISAICSDGVKQSGIYQAYVEVRNDEEEPDPEKIPDLDGEGSITWAGIKPKLVITGEFTIENTGDSESELDWEIGDTPDWGHWTFMPNEGFDLTPEDGEITVDVLLIAPDEKNQEFSGEIKVVNKGDGSDYITIPVSLTTQKYKGFDLYPFLLRFFEQHPMMFPLLRILLGL